MASSSASSSSSPALPYVTLRASGDIALTLNADGRVISEDRVVASWTGHVLHIRAVAAAGAPVSVDARRVKRARTASSTVAAAEATTTTTTTGHRVELGPLLIDAIELADAAWLLVSSARVLAPSLHTSVTGDARLLLTNTAAAAVSRCADAFLVTAEGRSCVHVEPAVAPALVRHRLHVPAKHADARQPLRRV
jgi:hypothetical protein